jgi:hypothetical protein
LYGRAQRLPELLFDSFQPLLKVKQSDRLLHDKIPASGSARV